MVLVIPALFVLLVPLVVGGCIVDLDEFINGAMYSPYPPSSTLTRRPPQQISAIFIISVVVHEKSSGFKSIPAFEGCPTKFLIFPTSPAEASKPIESSINDGLNARNEGINLCSIA